MSNAFSGDDGTAIRVNLYESLGAATFMRILIARPTSVDRYLFRSPSIVGGDHVIYKSAKGELPPGQYRVQVYYEDPDWKGYSTVAEFLIDKEMADASPVV